MQIQASDKKELRSGLTTGTCAAAVAKASAYMLINNMIIDHVYVTLPSGKEVLLELKDVLLTSDFAQCTTVKDAGDDPDITNGIELIGKSSFVDGKQISIKAGRGIGVVTKPGLSVEIGQPAINPVPLKMIQQSIAEVVGNTAGVEVEISIPEGERLAQKTFNPRLGIEGGISVLGTTGIVKPMSEEALKDSLVIRLRQLAAYGHQQAIFTPGNYGQAFSKDNLNIEEEQTVLTSNFIGFMLENALRLGFRRVVLVGHLGKLVKVAAGIFHTHSKVADARNEVLAANYFLFSKDEVVFDKIMNANTTEEVVEFIEDKTFWHFLVKRIKDRAQQHVHHELEVEVVLLSQKAGLLAQTSKAKQIMEAVKNGA
ncbi:cobalamin biosynthesis protein CbiD [Labilibacter sediminis]|nr:cobalamin biosynthesis protein CbiD [Labilibacter sediminis]